MAQEKAYAAAEQFSEEMRSKDVEADRLRFEMQGRQAKTNELESAIAVLKSSIQHNLESAQRIRADLEQQEGREGSLDQQIGQRKTRLAEIETQLEAGRSALAAKGREAEEAARSAGTLAKELEALRSQADLGTAGAAEAKALLSALAAAAQEVMDRDGAVRKESNELEDRLTEAQKEARTAQRRYDDAVEERDAVKNVIQGYQLQD